VREIGSSSNDQRAAFLLAGAHVDRHRNRGHQEPLMNSR
jgi:hypothetical protein